MEIYYSKCNYWSGIVSNVIKVSVIIWSVTLWNVTEPFLLGVNCSVFRSHLLHSHLKLALYKCELCSIKLKDEIEYQNHIQTEHNVQEHLDKILLIIFYLPYMIFNYLITWSKVKLILIIILVINSVKFVFGQTPVL